MRELRHKLLIGDLVVVGGGMAGICCSVTAARQGLKVILVQDRPLLGGNASSEVRLWVLGATSHMGNNNRWAREGGVIDELLVENLWRNPEGNSIVFDSILLEAVVREPNITLLLNTAINELEMQGAEIIRCVHGYNSQNQTAYSIQAPLFVDASGDGILSFLSGAEFRMGAEARSEFNEALAPSEPEQKLLGHSLYFYSRDTGQSVKYVAPTFALTDITKIPRYRDFRVSDTGCHLWWLEYGGDLDTVGNTEEIKWELWRIAYGVWNYIKNSGKFPEAETLTLEWMGMIPGKRESRRCIGDITLTQSHIIEQTTFEDAVSFGGWAIDLHPSDGVFSSEPACTQWHSKGVYQIPYRALYSRNICNLFLSGRLISATHIAFGSARVMATCASNGQAAGMAAALCHAEGLRPRDLLNPAHMHRLQQALLQSGQHIPGVPYCGEDDLARCAVVSASSSLKVRDLPSCGEFASSERPYALLLPLPAGPIPLVSLYARVASETKVRAELWTSSHTGNTTPDVLLSVLELVIPKGDRVAIPLEFKTDLAHSAHVFIMIVPQVDVALHLSTAQLPGVLSLSQKMNASVAKSLVQSPPEDSGIDTFAFWLPERRPEARLLAATFDPALCLFCPENAINEYTRPWRGTNAWAPAADDPAPTLKFDWQTVQLLRKISITFDTDFDHPMESVLLSHPERVMPGCITSFRVSTDEGIQLAEVTENHQTHWKLDLPEPVETRGLRIEILSHGDAPPAIFNVSCW